MTRVGPHHYNELFSVGTGAARRVPHGTRGLSDPAIGWGDAYSVYNAQLQKNFVVKHGFAAMYESTECPESGGRPLCEVLGAPLQNESGDGQGRAFQQFDRGYLTWTQAEGVRVHLDFPIGEGWARKLPSEWKVFPGATWGELFWVYNPLLKERFAVIHGFAQTYDAEMQAKLGLPRSNEISDGADGCYQEFDRGTLRWNPRDGITREFAVKAEIAPAGLRTLSKAEIAALSGGQLKTQRPPKLRIAPSPTGFMHIGNAWIATMNYLMAKKLGGEFLLRIEDTDPLRSRPEFTAAIKESLEWLGLKWDGEVIFQSQRSRRYQEKVDQLLASGHAYVDPKTNAVFFKMPDTGSVVIHDRVKGRVEVPLEDESGMRDFMLLRPDRSPMFLLANTVDDGDQEITHVIRGEGHLLNAARQSCLFRAMGYPVPEFYHLAHIVDEDGSKLSKREGASSVLDFKRRGIDPEVLLAHLSGLGMKSGTFDPFGFQQAPSRIGYGELLQASKKKIASLDTGALRKKLSAFDPDFMGRLDPIAAQALADASKKRASTYEEAIRIGKFVLSEPRYAERAAAIHLSPAKSAALSAIAERLSALSSWTLSALRGAGVPNEHAEAVQWILTGDTSGIPIENVMAVLGKEQTLARFDRVLGGKVSLGAEREEPAATAKIARPETARPPIHDLTGGKLTTWLRCAQALGAPTSEAYQDPPFSNVWMQNFERGQVRDDGAILFHAAPYWIENGKLQAFLSHHEQLGLPRGHAYQNADGLWVQDFERGQADDHAAVRLQASES